MKKGQKIFQKYVVTFAVILAAISILYALSFATPFAPFMDVQAAYKQQSDWEEIASANGSTKTYEDVVREQQKDKADKIIAAYRLVESDYVLFSEIQTFNQKLFTFTVIFLLLSLLLIVYKTSTRRKYYLSNYLVSIIYAVSGIALSVFAFVNIIGYYNAFSSIDFTKVSDTVFLLKQVTVSGDATMFYIGFALFGLIIANAVLLLVNMLWKYLANKKDAKDFKEIDAEIRAKQAEKEQKLLLEAQMQMVETQNSNKVGGEAQ